MSPRKKKPDEARLAIVCGGPGEGTLVVDVAGKRYLLGSMALRRWTAEPNGPARLEIDDIHLRSHAILEDWEGTIHETALIIGGSFEAAPPAARVNDARKALADAVKALDALREDCRRASEITKRRAATKRKAGA